jgi:hypothetical protein
MVPPLFLMLVLTAAPGVNVEPLFVLGRSKNANVVEYAARVSSDGMLDDSKPFEAFWVLKAQDGRREALSYLEEQLAYGFSWKVLSARREYILTMNAFRARPLAVVPHGDSYQVVASLGGVPSRLLRLFVTADESVGLPQVKSVELFGESLIDGAPTHEWLMAPKPLAHLQAHRDDPF